MKQDRLQLGSCCRDPQEQRVGRVAHHPCTSITLPPRCGVPTAPQLPPLPPQGFISLHVAAAPQCVTLNPTNPSPSVHFSPNAPPCTPRCLILYPSVQHPKSTTAAPPPPEHIPYPVPAALPRPPDPPPQPHFMHAPACCSTLRAPKALLHPTLCYPVPLRQCPPAANIWPRTPRGWIQRASFRLSPNLAPDVHPPCPQ